MAKRQKQSNASASIPWLSDDDLRRELTALPPAEVVELVVDLVRSDPAVRTRVHLRACTKGTAPSTSTSDFRSAIDRILDIRFVEWNQVDAYVARLDGTLADIVALGAKSPSDALDVALYFIQAIPSIFDSVHDETELATFCEDLCATALSLQRNAGRSLPTVAAQLLDAFLEDGHGRFQEIPKQLASHCQSEERAWLREEATRRSAAADPFQRSLLGAITAPTANATGGRTSRRAR